MVSNLFFKNISSKEKENLLIELSSSKKQLDEIELTLLSLIEENSYTQLTLKETLNCIFNAKNNILSSISSNNGSNLYIAKNALTGEIYSMKETSFSFEEIEHLKNLHTTTEINVYSIKEYDEFYNEQDGVYYYNNEGIKKSLYANYEDLLHEK